MHFRVTITINYGKIDLMGNFVFWGQICMQTHSVARVITGLVALISILAVFFLNLSALCQSAYWTNVALGIFGSAFIAYILATISFNASRKEAILNYLGALYIYRYKLKRMQSALSENASGEKIGSLVPELDEFFYKLHYEYYSKTHHIIKKSHSAQTLDSVFDQIKDIAQKIRLSNQVIPDLQEASDDMILAIDEAICRVEKLSISLKLMRPVTPQVD